MLVCIGILIMMVAMFSGFYQKYWQLRKESNSFKVFCFEKLHIKSCRIFLTLFRSGCSDTVLQQSIEDFRSFKDFCPKIHPCLHLRFIFRDAEEASKLQRFQAEDCEDFLGKFNNIMEKLSEKVQKYVLFHFQKPKNLRIRLQSIFNLRCNTGVKDGGDTLEKKVDKQCE